MPDRHRGPGRDLDRPRSRDRGDEPRGREPRDERGPRGPRGPRDLRDNRGPRDFRDLRDARESRGRGAAPPFRERRPPAPPPTAGEAETFEDVDADLAIAILETATKLTEIVGTAGLPEGHAERREAVIESFEAIYNAVLDAVTGDEDEDEDE